MTTTPPKVLFYVQYLLGIGHVRRSSLVAKSLAQQGFDVHIAFGGVPVKKIDFSPATLHHLTPIKVADDSFSKLLHQNGTPLTDADKTERCQQLLELATDLQPNIILTETFPFGRRQMRFELLPLLAWAEAQSPRPLIISSIRDILQRRKAKREQESLGWAERFYDYVLVHGDKQFTPLEASFPPAQQISDKLAYSGYVCPPAPEVLAQRQGIIISIGSGTIGHRLIATALALYQQGYAADSQWSIMTGPNMPEAIYKKIAAQADKRLTVYRMATDFVERLAAAKLSVSLGGYNTTMDILQTGVPAVVSPYEGIEESEQLERTEMLDAAGCLTMIRYHDLSTDTLRQAMDQALEKSFKPLDVDTAGALHSAQLMQQWWQASNENNTRSTRQ